MFKALMGRTTVSDFLNAARRAILQIAAIVILVTVVTGCDFTVSKGELHGLRIGETNLEVLAELKKRRVESIRPDIIESIVVRGTNADLRKLQQQHSVCLTDNAAIAINLEFDERSTLQRIDQSAATPTPAFGLKTQQTMDEVFARLQPELAKNNKLILGTCMPNARWIDIQMTKMSENDVEYLLSNEGWWYDEPNSYSSIRLTFKSGRLASISYFWRPFDFR